MLWRQHRAGAKHVWGAEEGGGMGGDDGVCRYAWGKNFIEVEQVGVLVLV